MRLHRWIPRTLRPFSSRLQHPSSQYHGEAWLYPPHNWLSDKKVEQASISLNQFYKMLKTFEVTSGDKLLR